MARNRFQSNFLILIVALILLLSAGYIHVQTKKPLLKIKKQNSALNFNNDLLQIFSFGQKRVITDLLWISTLLESDVDHYRGDELKSWIYQRFLSTVLLDPKFLQAYQFGGQYLAIVKDDLQGAKDIYERGLKVYPNDFKLNYNAAFLYAFELKDYKRAKELYSKIKNHSKSPQFIESIINKLGFNIDKDLSLAFTLVKENYDSTPNDSPFKTKLFNELYAIKAEIDLDCLNRSLENCSYYDLTGLAYLKKNNTYYAQKEFKRYRLKESKK